MLFCVILPASKKSSSPQCSSTCVWIITIFVFEIIFCDRVQKTVQVTKFYANLWVKGRKLVGGGVALGHSATCFVSKKCQEWPSKEKKKVTAGNVGKVLVIFRDFVFSNGCELFVLQCKQVIKK